MHVPGRGEGVVATVDEGDVVGWSWLVPPYRWFFDARAVTEVSAVSVDAGCLREKCDEDPALGYALMQRVAQVMYQRLQSARIRMLDLYGAGHGRLTWRTAPSPVPPSGDPMVPRPFRVAGVRRDTHDTVDAGPASPRRRAAWRSRPGQFTMLQAFGVGEVPISISGDPAEPDRLDHTVRDVGGVTRTLCAVTPGDVLGVRGAFGRGWDVTDGAGATW